MPGFLPSLIILGLVAVPALGFAASRQSPPESVAERRAASRALVLAVVAQGFHFVEEAMTGLQEQLPALFDLPGISFSVFVSVNLIAFGIWVASVPGLRSGRSGAFFAAWFLAIAGMANAALHPLAAIVAGGYFPGLVSSPLAGLAGLRLWRKLRGATRVKWAKA